MIDTQDILRLHGFVGNVRCNGCRMPFSDGRGRCIEIAFSDRRPDVIQAKCHRCQHVTNIPVPDRNTRLSSDTAYQRLMEQQIAREEQDHLDALRYASASINDTPIDRFFEYLDSAGLNPSKRDDGKIFIKTPKKKKKVRTV